MITTMQRILLIALLATSPFFATAQRIILDLPTKIGELTAFPEVNNPDNYYYVTDKARLATDSTGRPRFSMLRYVSNVVGTGDQGLTQGEGGGIVHAVVSLSVTEAQRAAAVEALREINPSATLVGPVIFKSGTFGLITSFSGEDGKLTRTVVGTGKAPILDGQQAAISMHLTKLGATLLWNSFKTAAPDISFTFEMNMDGFRLPVQAVITANFEDIYEATEKRFSIGLDVGDVAGAAVSAGGSPAAGAVIPDFFIGADFQDHVEELTKNGTIKVEQIGSDAAMDKIIEIAYTKLADLLLDQVEAEATGENSPERQLQNLSRTNAMKEDKEMTKPSTGLLFTLKKDYKKT